jgi:hypothetical protein
MREVDNEVALNHHGAKMVEIGVEMVAGDGDECCDG